MGKTVSVNIRITEDMKRALDALSKVSDTPVSELVRIALDHHLISSSHGFDEYLKSNPENENLLSQYDEELNIINSYIERIAVKYFSELQKDVLDKQNSLREHFKSVE